MAPAAGNIAWSVEDGATVEADAVVAKLGGFARHEARLNEGVDRGKYYGEKLAEAQAKGDTAAAEGGAAQGRREEAHRRRGHEGARALLHQGPGGRRGEAARRQGRRGQGRRRHRRDRRRRRGRGRPDAARHLRRRRRVVELPGRRGLRGRRKDAQDRRFACVVEKVADGKVDVRLVAVSGSATAVPGDEVVLLPADSK
jgi:hypothetical protein